MNKSYVISVSLEVGCYRHLKAPGEASLEQLSEAILAAFDFDNDHAHGFFMDNKAWSPSDCYYMDLGEYDEDDVRHTCDYKLTQLNLETGKKFLYIFDFGDEWRFQCKILKVLDEISDEFKVIKKTGVAPEQY